MKPRPIVATLLAAAVVWFCTYTVLSWDVPYVEPGYLPSLGGLALTLVLACCFLKAASYLRRCRSELFVLPAAVLGLLGGTAIDAYVQLSRLFVHQGERPFGLSDLPPLLALAADDLWQGAILWGPILVLVAGADWIVRMAILARSRRRGLVDA